MGGHLSGTANNAVVLNDSHNHTILYATDDRDVKPNTSGIGLGVGAIKPFFTSLAGMTGSANTDYQDLIILDTWNDSSGGKPNAITFDKSEIAVRAWQGEFTGSTWGTPERFYLDNYHPNADTLTTARTINGTSFDGSANITTANWGTARTLTIGNTGKSVNGSANVSWTLAEIGATPLTSFNTYTGSIISDNVTRDARITAISDKTGSYDSKLLNITQFGTGIGLAMNSADTILEDSPVLTISGSIYRSTVRNVTRVDPNVGILPYGGFATGYSSTLSHNGVTNGLRYTHFTVDERVGNTNVLEQIGFQVSPMTLATTIYGYRGLISSGSNRWNLYMDGTANNYLAGNLLIGTTSNTGETLQIVGSAKITSDVNSNSITTNFITDPSYRTFSYPGGGTFRTTTATLTGAIQIKLPVPANNNMLKMRVEIFDYAVGESFTVFINGYYHITGPTWANVTGYILGDPSINRNFTIRFGYDASNIGVITIGETNSTWSYPHVTIAEVIVGFGGYSYNMGSGYEISFVTTLPTTINQTISSKQIGYALSTNTANTTVLRDGSGNFSAGTITATLSGNASTATTLQTARTINGVSFNGSANITVPTPNTLTIGTGLTGASFNGSSATTIAIDSTVTTLTGTQTLTNKTLTSPRIGTGIFDTNGNEVIQIIPTTNAVNDLSIQNAATGQPVVLTTSGTDANINLAIRTKGTGNIEIDTGTSTGTIDIKPGASNLRLWDNNSTHYYEFVTGDRTANYTITLPASNVELVGGTMVPTSRTITIANGTGITGGSTAVDLSTNRSWTIGLTGQALALHNLATNGIISRTGTGTVAARTISAGTGITVTNGDGVSGNPTISLPNSGVTAGTYRSVTTDATGRITAGTNPTTISEYGITDAQTASRSSATFTTTANGWYRIATSALNINRNSGEFVVDWSTSGQHGSIRFAAAIHYSASPSIMQTNYSLFGTGGITEARIVYHTTYTGNYAYVEVKFASAVTNVAVNVELQDELGWTLVTPSTVGSIPSGYTSYDHTFVTAATIIAGTYTKVTINQEGRTTSGTTLSAADIPNLDTSKLTTGTLPVARGGTGVTTSTGTGNVVLSTSPTLTTPNIGNATGGTLSLSGQLTSTLANSTTTNGGQIFLNGATGNRIDWNTNGVAFPTFTTRSVGTKLTIFPGVAAAAVDYAIGIGTSSIWYSTSTTSTFHRWYAGTTNVMTLTGTGRLLINTTIDNGNELNVGGNISCTTITETSSRRYKDNIIPIENSLDKITKLQGVTYTRKDTNNTEYGLIAEEVYDVLPELVNKNLDGEVESISYGRITSLLIESIKEQQKQIEKQQIQINKLIELLNGNS